VSRDRLRAALELPGGRYAEMDADYRQLYFLRCLELALLLVVVRQANAFLAGQILGHATGTRSIRRVGSSSGVFTQGYIIL
jgi:hypothetical protein